MTNMPVTQTMTDGERLIGLYQNLWATDADLVSLKEYRSSETSLELLSRLVLPVRAQSVLDVPVTSTELSRPANLEQVIDIGQRTLDAFFSEVGEAATYKRFQDARENAADDLRFFYKLNEGRMVTVTQLPNKRDSIFNIRAMRHVLTATGKFWIPYVSFDHYNMSDIVVKKPRHFGRYKNYAVSVRNYAELEPSISVDFE